MADNFYNGVRYGDEVHISIGKYDSTIETDGAFEYTEVAHREGFSPDFPENSEAIFDGLKYVGDKKIQVEKSLTITQAAPSDYGSGLYAFENLDGLVIKEEIIPNDGSTVDDGVRYFTNVNLRQVAEDDVPNNGAFNITINGRYDDIVKEEPDFATDDWIRDYSA